MERALGPEGVRVVRDFYEGDLDEHEGLEMPTFATSEFLEDNNVPALLDLVGYLCQQAKLDERHLEERAQLLESNHNQLVELTGICTRLIAVTHTFMRAEEDRICDLEIADEKKDLVAALQRCEEQARVAAAESQAREKAMREAFTFTLAQLQTPVGTT